VDDEEPIRAVALQVLQKFGYRVVTAGNGEEALRIYAQQPNEIALVITDMMMPVMDGPATIHAILEINPRAHILAVSGYSSSDGVARAVAAGGKYFLAKPYSAEALLTLLREMLRGGPAEGASSSGAISAPFP
jgi:CheY-like chemotaxis protein